ncbi:hypothetical protein Aab01nite_13060 [Paractinoplanes abujensis]|uniref:Uncharacterized protein n=1 Tax=Paractinoplanes abujensis TaxID=882441 RepID=A0A7W7CLQ7_9ACTN|nr:hypothetical protein [Actinoplanes abujensis]MBB4690871.1 hypothetical protein [Actinoplanes abujensis]GID17716.1 hypothetical protein Aab01nite_13060 [Actinoplanes abujensis]
MSDTKIDVLVVRWYERRNTTIVRRWLDAAREHLPEAVPVRFGDTEPLRGRGGAEELQAAWARAAPLLFATGKKPVLGISMAGGGTDWPVKYGPTVVHSLTVATGPDDVRVKAFARAVASDDTFYTSASTAGGMTLDRNTLWGPAERREEPYLAPQGDWLGLPPTPPAWCLFGPDYAKLATYGEGSWVSERLRARLDETEPSRRQARKMPRGLRRSAWQLITGR